MTDGGRVRRPVKRAVAKPPAEAEASRVDERVAAPPADVPGGSLTFGFFICLSIGLVFCLLGLSPHPTLKKIGLIGPVLATILYPLWGLVSGTLKRHALRERFGDNCYYLGFIFTQAALLFAFLPITMWGRNVSSEDVLGFFGMAVGASLAGLISRTLIVQTGKSMPETDDSLHREVEDLARQVADRARSIVGEFDTLSRSVAAVPKAMAARLDNELDMIAGTLTRYNEVLRREVASFEAGAATVARAADDAAASYLAHQQGFGEHVKGVAESVDRLREALAVRLAETLEIVRSGTGSIANAVASLEGLALVRDDVAALNENLVALGDSTRALASEADRMKGTMDRAAAAVVEALDGSAEVGAARLTQAAESAAATLASSAEAGAVGLGDAARTAAATLEAAATKVVAGVSDAADAAAADLRSAGQRSTAAVSEQAASFATEVGAATAQFSETLIRFRDELRRLRSESDATPPAS